ncbi:hypothetical protein ACH42_11770 [Endozoicomonas sp. (ex Bugula neritina AB1)]|nr:hypothetical protein ACH42_11770 [Endozoicomonas sp. (ex Bugula neritina AB1)]
MKKSVNQRGFTLIELMIVIVIMGILLLIAVPNYQDFLRDGRQSEGQTALLDIAARQEQFFMENRTYTNILADLGIVRQNTTNGFYRITITCPGNPQDCSINYTARATAQNAQAGAGNLTINALGVRNWN